MEGRIASFLAQRLFAVVGASVDRSKFGNKVLRNYMAAGKVARRPLRRDRAPSQPTRRPSLTPRSPSIHPLPAPFVAAQTVIPVNPNVKEIEGIPTVARLADIPDRTSLAVSVVTPPAVSEKIVQEAAQLGIKHVWLQPGAESPAAIAYAETNGIELVHDTCVLMRPLRT